MRIEINIRLPATTTPLPPPKPWKLENSSAKPQKIFSSHYNKKLSRWKSAQCGEKAPSRLLYAISLFPLLLSRRVWTQYLLLNFRKSNTPKSISFPSNKESIKTMTLFSAPTIYFHFSTVSSEFTEARKRSQQCCLIIEYLNDVFTPKTEGKMCADETKSGLLSGGARSWIFHCGGFGGNFCAMSKWNLRRRPLRKEKHKATWQLKAEAKIS